MSLSSEVDVVDVEADLRALWCTILKVEDVPDDADFFSLGGASLEAMVVTAKASKALGAKLPVRLLLSSPVLADYARAVKVILDGRNNDAAKP